MATGAVSETLSFEEFLDAYADRFAEWVDGVVYPMTPATPRHQKIASFFTALMQHAAEAERSGIVLSAPVAMRVGKAAREPDVMFVSRDHEDRVTPRCVEGPADLVVEVVSPDSRTRDRGEKFYEYEEAGVREYWLVDPLRESLELFRLSARGTYETVAPDDRGRLRSEVLEGLWIDPAWLWRDPMPTLISVLKQWGLV